METLYNEKSQIELLWVIPFVGETFHRDFILFSENHEVKDL